jgi:hypothetical protein
LAASQPITVKHDFDLRDFFRRLSSSYCLSKKSWVLTARQQIWESITDSKEETNGSFSTVGKLRYGIGPALRCS